MDRKTAKAAKVARYIGKICPKHEKSFKGQRYTRNGNCVGCHKDVNETRRLKNLDQHDGIQAARERRALVEAEARAIEMTGVNIRMRAVAMSNVSRGTRLDWRDFWAEAYGAHVVAEMQAGRTPLQGVKMPETSDQDLRDWRELKREVDRSQ